MKLERIYVVEGLGERLNQIENKLDCLTRKVEKMNETLDQVLEKVGEVETVADSSITLLRGIKKMLDDALKGGISPAQQAKIDSIFSRLESQKTEIADAILENTPQEETPPVEPPV